MFTKLFFASENIKYFVTVLDNRGGEKYKYLGWDLGAMAAYMMKEWMYNKATIIKG